MIIAMILVALGLAFTGTMIPENAHPSYMVNIFCTALGIFIGAVSHLVVSITGRTPK